MNAAVKDLTAEYTLALREHLEGGGGEAALMRAYQLGRSAIAEGLGVLEVAALHQEALVAALLKMLAPGESAAIAKRASEFFSETLAPFEMTRRGFLEANAILRHMNQGLQDQLEEQRRLERLKNEFISIVSHELRTPLTSIHGALGLIETGAGGELSPQGRQLIDVAYRNSQRLVRLVDDILDLQKIESGAMPFKIRPLELRPLLEQALEANEAYGSRLGVSFVLGEAPPGANVQADPDRLMQVLTNLLANAAKFSPRGETVAVSATRRGTSVRVSVRDRGPGIPESFQDLIFQKFAQADSSSTRTKGGSGLGLSISKAIIERLGGTIGFETAPSAGTTFFFDLREAGEDGGSRKGAMP